MTQTCNKILPIKKRFFFLIWQFFLQSRYKSMKGLQATWSGPMFSWRSDGKRSMAGTTGISKLLRLTLSFDVCSFCKMMQWQYDMLTCSTPHIVATFPYSHINRNLKLTTQITLVRVVYLIVFTMFKKPSWRRILWPTAKGLIKAQHAFIFGHTTQNLEKDSRHQRHPNDLWSLRMGKPVRQVHHGIGSGRFCCKTRCGPTWRWKHSWKTRNRPPAARRRLCCEPARKCCCKRERLANARKWWNTFIVDSWSQKHLHKKKVYKCSFMHPGALSS